MTERTANINKRKIKSRLINKNLAVQLFVSRFFIYRNALIKCVLVDSNLTRAERRNAMNQYNKNIELIPTKYPNIFDVALRLGFQTRYIGRLDKSGEGRFLTKRKEKHIHRKTNSLGVNLELLKLQNFKWLQISLGEKKLLTTREFFLHYGKVLNFQKAGFELQSFLPLNLFGAERAIAFENNSQGDLFNQAA